MTKVCATFIFPSRDSGNGPGDKTQTKTGQNKTYHLISTLKTPSSIRHGRHVFH